MSKNSKYRFLRKLTKKYRLVILNDGTFKERVVIKITPLLIFSIMLVISFLIIFFSFSIINGFKKSTTDKTNQDNNVSSQLELDSLKELSSSQKEKIELYVENFKTILRGGVPVSENEIKNSDFIEKDVDLEKTDIDSFFSVKIEKKPNRDYILSQSNNTILFFPPIIGSFTEKYDKKKNHFGVDLVSKVNSFIHSVADGVVVINNWTKETGFVIGVQHSNGFLSFYKHNSKILKNVGEFVGSGEAVAIIGDSGELSSGPHLHFELWKNGESLDPENYIVF